MHPRSWVFLRLSSRPECRAALRHAVEGSWQRVKPTQFSPTRVNLRFTLPRFAFFRPGSPNTIPPLAPADISIGSVPPRRSRCSPTSPVPPRMPLERAAHEDPRSGLLPPSQNRRLKRMRIHGLTHSSLPPRHLLSCWQVLLTRECCVPLCRRCATPPRSESLPEVSKRAKHSGLARSCPLAAFAANLRVPQASAIAEWRPSSAEPCQIRSRTSRMAPSFVLLLLPERPAWSIQWSGFLPRNKKAPSDTPRA